MRWPWQRRRRPQCKDAAQARQEAEGKLAETRKQLREVREVAEGLRRARRRNRFAEMIEASMRPRT